MPLDKEKFKDLFISEAEEQIATLSRILLELEKNPSQPEEHEILMRSAHTIKGSAATMGYGEITHLAHAIENVFHQVFRSALVLDTTLVTTLLSSVDALSDSLIAIKNNEPEFSTGMHVATLEQILSPVKGDSLAPVGGATPPQRELHVLATPNVVKVNTDKLDALMGIFEELLMLQLKFDTLLAPALDVVRATTDTAWKQKLFFVHELHSLFGEMSKLLSENQEALLAIRLVPLDQIFGQYPRMVRDLAVREEKKILFTSTGGDIALDRAVIDGLGGALAHLLRNAVDHGIAKSGNILLSASRAGGRAKIVVEDNGKGIDYDRVREVALARGVETKERLDAMSTSALAEVIFHPNMSTNNEVTDISGRGVGVSAVYAFARDVGGRLEVISPIPETGVGTRFTLDLPVSLATIRVLIILVSGRTFAVPFEHIHHTLEFKESEVTSVLHQETIFVDGVLLPLLRLKNILGLTFSAPTATPDPHAGRSAIVAQVKEMRVVLPVDAYMGERELLVKSLPPVLHGISGFAGSALLPDGRTILLLDMHGLLNHAVGDILGGTPH